MNITALNGTVALVTGASSGIGDATARQLAEHGASSRWSDRFGRLDILINNAGLMLLGPVVGADVAEWERMIAVNQTGLLYVTHAALVLAASDAANIPERLEPEDVADGITYMVTRPRRSSVAEL
jgi:NADP-dependent 3-hydroxy acid dehydrogenase YdfG